MDVKKPSRLDVKGRRSVAAKRRASSTKLAISFDGRLASEVQRAARKKTAGNVSAWLAEAARDRLRLEGGRQLLAEYEAEHGAISKAQIARVEREWPRD
jgi:plasmid stabilization system protein ParE